MKFIYSIILMGLLMTNVTHAEEQSDKMLVVAQSFLDAAGSGNGEKLNELMSDDFVWHNEGDSNIPWIGPWEGRQS